jgi:outer membrane assembly lipoprotein YfiO
MTLFTRFSFLGIFLCLSAPLMAMGPMGFGQKPAFADPSRRAGAPQDENNKKKPRKNPLVEKPLPELKKGLEEASKAKDTATALKYLDAMRMVSTDHDQIREILLQMADLYYQQSEWTKAERAYNEFILLYPGAAKCDYAHYKAVECGFNLTSQSDRDQTKTQEVLALAEQFFTDHAQSEFFSAVTKLATDCREKLLASDTNIFNFYVKNNNFKAAQKRLDLISKEHGPKMPNAQPKVLEMTIQLAQAQNDQVKVWQTQLQLVDKFPDNDITKRLALAPDQIRANLAQHELAKSSLPQESITIAQGTPKAKTT